MIKNNGNIQNIPATVWGEERDKLIIAVHGNLSHKEDVVIQILAEEAIKKGYQVLSFDLPEHGERKDEETPYTVQIYVHDLTEILTYAKHQWKEISLFACSMGAYFSLLAYHKFALQQALFLSPVVDMERIISNMMMWFQITPLRLQEEGTISTPAGQKLYWDYFCYVKEHPIDTWDADTRILYGAKDNLCESDTIQHFAEKFGCTLEIMEEGEHYFHTHEQLDTFSRWISTHMQE